MANLGKENFSEWNRQLSKFTNRSAATETENFFEPASRDVFCEHLLNIRTYLYFSVLETPKRKLPPSSQSEIRPGKPLVFAEPAGASLARIELAALPPNCSRARTRNEEENVGRSVKIEFSHSLSQRSVAFQTARNARFA